MEKILYITTREESYVRNSSILRSLRDLYTVETHYLLVDKDSEAGFAVNKVAMFLQYFNVAIKAVVALLKASRRSSEYKFLFLGMHTQLTMPFVRLFWRGVIISDMFVSIYDTVCFDKGKFKPNSIVGKLLRSLDRMVLNNSDIIFTDTKAHANYIGEITNLPGKEIIPLPIGVRSTLSEVDTVMAHESSSTESFKVGFFGSFIPLQGCKYIVEAASILSDQDIMFEIIGEGQEYEEVLEYARSRGLNNIQFLGWGKHSELNQMLNSSDLILGIFGDTRKTQNVIPNKVYEASWLGKPILTADTPAIREVFQDGKNIYLVPTASAEDIATAIINIMKLDRSELVQLGKRGQSTIKEHASDENIKLILRDGIERAFK